MLIGNYGVGNWGDEALRERFLSRYAFIDWIVVSATPNTPDSCARLPCGIRSFCSLRWVHTLRLLRSMDAVVFGGGTLFTDIESPKACLLWWLHVTAARLLGVPVLAAAQGVGPFTTVVGRVLAQHALRTLSFLSVRDDASAMYAETIGMSSKVVRSFDPVLLSFNPQSGDSAKNVLIIIPRANGTDAFMQTALQEARAWQGKVRVVLFEPGDPREQSWARDFQARVGRDIEVHSVVDTAGVLNACSQAARLVTQRYHGGIAALALGIPYVRIPQSAGDKLARLPESTDIASVAQLRAAAERGEAALEEFLRTLPAAKARQQ